MPTLQEVEQRLAAREAAAADTARALAAMRATREAAAEAAALARLPAFGKIPAEELAVWWAKGRDARAAQNDRWEKSAARIAMLARMPRAERDVFEAREAAEEEAARRARSEAAEAEREEEQRRHTAAFWAKLSPAASAYADKLPAIAKARAKAINGCAPDKVLAELNKCAANGGFDGRAYNQWLADCEFARRSADLAEANVWGGRKEDDWITAALVPLVEQDRQLRQMVAGARTLRQEMAEHFKRTRYPSAAEVSRWLSARPAGILPDNVEREIGWRFHREKFQGEAGRRQGGRIWLYFSDVTLDGKLGIKLPKLDWIRLACFGRDDQQELAGFLRSPVFRLKSVQVSRKGGRWQAGLAFHRELLRGPVKLHLTPETALRAVLAVFRGSGADRMHAADLAARISRQDYKASAVELGRMLAAAGVKAEQMRIGGRNRNGYARADVQAALAARAPAPEGGQAAPALQVKDAADSVLDQLNAVLAAGGDWPAAYNKLLDVAAADRGGQRGSYVEEDDDYTDD